MKYLTIFVISGITVSAVVFLSEKGNNRLAGILVFAPIVSLYSYLFINHFEGASALREVVRSTAYAIPAIVVFILSLFFLLKYVNGYISTPMAVVFWLFTILIVNRDII